MGCSCLLRTDGTHATHEEAAETMSARILYAEDDRAVRDAVVRALTIEGYDVTAVHDGQSALEAATQGGWGLIVLDVLMPFVDGLSVCRRLRATRDLTPILMLTARAETPDRVSGLDAGADAYLAKPFDVEEFLAHVRALLRRGSYGDAVDGIPLVGDLRIDEAARRAWRGDRELDLTKTEFDLLAVLARNTGVVLSHSSLYEQVWNYDFGPDSKNLAVYMSYLRRKVDAEQDSPILHTVRGVGYTLRVT